MDMSHQNVPFGYTHKFNEKFNFEFQDPNEDTEWNDILRAKGILPPKTQEAEITEETIVNMVEKAVENKLNSTLFIPKILLLLKYIF